MGNGMGGTDTIPDEFAPSLTFDRPGRVAMANAGPQTGSSQFFITDAPTPHLNGRHTIFGQVVDGQDVEQKIARVPRDEENDKPKTPVRIVRITFKRSRARTPAGRRSREALNFKAERRKAETGRSIERNVEVDQLRSGRGMLDSREIEMRTTPVAGLEIKETVRGFARRQHLCRPASHLDLLGRQRILFAEADSGYRTWQSCSALRPSQVFDL